MLMSALE
jgi:hypothetical protein